MVHTLLCMALALVLVGLVSSDSGMPHLLALKSVDRMDAVQSENLTVSINLFNIGKTTAFEVGVYDDTWPSAGVTQVEGSRNITIPKINAGANYTHVYTLSPVLPGELVSAAARIEYYLEHKGEETKVMYSNALPILPVLTKAEYDKRTTKHLKEWFLFLLLSCIPVALPGIIYMQADTKLRERSSRDARRAKSQ